MAQRRSARRICKDFSPSTSATSLVEKLDLQTLKERRNIDKVTMLYKIKMGEGDTLADSILKTTTRSTRGQPQKLLVPQSRTTPPPAFLLPLSHPTLEYSPTSLHCSSLSTGLQGLLEGVGTQCLKTPSILLCFILFIYSFIYLFIYLFIHLFIYLFIHSFIYSFIHLFFYSFLSFFLSFFFFSFFLPFFLSLFIYLFVCLFIQLVTYFFSFYLFVYLLTYSFILLLSFT